MRLTTCAVEWLNVGDVVVVGGVEDRITSIDWSEDYSRVRICLAGRRSITRIFGAEVAVPYMPAPVCGAVGIGAYID